MKLRITENEVTNTYYGVFETGGSIGSHKEDDFYGRAGSKNGKLVKVFDNDTDAKEYAKRMRKYLSPGERKYYGYGYFTKPLTSKDIENSIVQEFIKDVDINENVSNKIKLIKENSFNDKLADSIVIDKALEEEIKGAIEDGGYEVETSYFRGNKLYLNVKFIDVPVYLYHQNTQDIEETLNSIAEDIEDTYHDVTLNYDVALTDYGAFVETWLEKEDIKKESLTGSDIVEFSTYDEAIEFCKDNNAPYDIICYSNGMPWIKKEIYDKYVSNIDDENESLKRANTNKKSIKENNNNDWPALDAARYYLNKDYTDEEVWKALDKKGCDDEYIQNVIDYMNELFDEYEEEPFESPYGHIW